MKTKFSQVHFRGRSTLQKSGNFTFLITVGNLSLAKMQFWLVAKQKEEIGK